MDRRLLLVHAHPDDESISTGATIARYVAEGARVCVVTCTRGEQGEIVPEDLRHLGTGKALADVRVDELAAAVKELGVTDHRYLGPYEDSGMIGTPENERATAFWNADLEEAAAHLVTVIRDVRPQVVVTYDENGGYGHPDHIQAHRVTRLAIAAAAPEWQVAKLYFTAGRSTPEADITTVIDAEPWFEQKVAAMRAHRTQLTVDPPYFTLSDNVARATSGVERYVLAAGDRGPAAAGSHETDLFAGLA